MPKSIPCVLPPYLTQDTLPIALNIRRERGATDEILAVDGKSFRVPANPPIALYIDWSNVLYFDDAALLQLMLLQHHLLQSGIGLTHFRLARKRKPTKSSPYVSQFLCRPHPLPGGETAAPHRHHRPPTTTSPSPPARGSRYQDAATSAARDSDTEKGPVKSERASTGQKILGSEFGTFRDTKPLIIDTKSCRNLDDYPDWRNVRWCRNELLRKALR